MDIIEGIRIFVDENLTKNSIVEESVKNVRKLYKEYKSEESYINALNNKLNKCYLNIEREPIIDKIKLAEGKCKEIKKQADINLSPYEWKYVNYDNCDCLCLMKERR